LYLVQKVCLLFFQSFRQPLGLGSIHGYPKSHALLVRIRLGHFLVRARLSPLLASQIASELGLVPPPVIEVDCVCCAIPRSVSPQASGMVHLRDSSWCGRDDIPSKPVASAATVAVAMTAGCEGILRDTQVPWVGECAEETGVVRLVKSGESFLEEQSQVEASKSPRSPLFSTKFYRLANGSLQWFVPLF
jgi:hypothetical protein